MGKEIGEEKAKVKELIRKFKELLYFYPRLIPEEIKDSFRKEIEDYLGEIKKDAKPAFLRMVEKGLREEIEYTKAEKLIEDLATKGKQFGPKRHRQDVLSREIEKTLLNLKKKNGKEPTAREVLKALPKDGKYEIEIDYGIDSDDEAEAVIHWTNQHGVPKSTSFKSFQKRLTLIKKKSNILTF